MVLVARVEKRQEGGRVERTLAVFQKADLPETAEVLFDLGSVEQMEGHPAKAERLFRQAIERRTRSKGPDDPAIGQWLTGLAAVLLGQHQYEEGSALRDRRSPSAAMSRLAVKATGTPLPIG